MICYCILIRVCTIKDEDSITSLCSCQNCHGIENLITLWRIIILILHYNIHCCRTSSGKEGVTVLCYNGEYFRSACLPVQRPGNKQLPTVRINTEAVCSTNRISYYSLETSVSVCSFKTCYNVAHLCQFRDTKGVHGLVESW